MKDDLRSLSLAILLSFIAIFTVNYFFGINKSSTVQKQVSEIEQVAKKLEQVNTENKVIKTTQEILAEDKRIDFKNDAVSGSIRLKGARFDDLYLTKYNVSLEDNNSKIELLKPANTDNQYFADLGWLSLDKSLKLPTADTIWNTNDSELTPGKTITLTWNNGNGLEFVRKISLDQNYLFTIDDTIFNNSDQEIDLFPYALISRNIKDFAQTRSVVHEGMNGVIDNTLQEFKYADLDANDSEKFETKGGWAGFSDRYWFSALILDDKDNVSVTFKNNGDYNYQVDYLGSRLIVPAHKSQSYSYRFFSGAKEVKLLDSYTKDNNIPKFDLAVDFGWYYFLTKPFFYILDFLYGFLGNMGWAILLFAALLRLCMFPIANKSYTSMAKMKALQPKINDIRAKYGDNQMLIQQATMELYKREKINPAAGCLPLFIQIPVFFSLYKVLNISIEIRHAPFIGWIKDLSAPDPLTLSQILHIYVPLRYIALPQSFNSFLHNCLLYIAAP